MNSEKPPNKNSNAPPGASGGAKPRKSPLPAAAVDPKPGAPPLLASDTHPNRHMLARFRVYPIDL